VLVLVPTVAFLVVATTPFFSLRLANGDVDMLPTHIEARQGYDRLVADSPDQNETSFSVVVDYPDGNPLTRDRIADQFTLTRRIAQIPGVNAVFSIYNLDPNLGLYEYTQMYTGDASNLPAQAQQFVSGTVGKHIVLIQAKSALDPSIPVILFSIVFGLSMDYEVLLVSRMHEEYVRLGDNTAAVASGLDRTGRLITGAAAIMFTVFMAFGLAEVVIIKAIGIGLAIAVAIDATIVRSLLVPAVMRLLGDANWWAPRPLRWMYDRIGIGDLGVQPLRQ